MGSLCSSPDNQLDYFDRRYDRSKFITYKSKPFRLEYQITKKIGVGNLKIIVNHGNLGQGCEVQEVEHKMTKVRRACKIFDKDEGVKLVDPGFIRRIFNSISIMQELVKIWES